MSDRVPPIEMETLAAAHAPDDAEPAEGTGLEAAATDLGTSPKSIALMRSGMERSGWTLWMLTICAALSGSLFGYDTGYMYVALLGRLAHAAPPCWSALAPTWATH